MCHCCCLSVIVTCCSSAGFVGKPETEDYLVRGSRTEENGLGRLRGVSVNANGIHCTARYYHECMVATLYVNSWSCGWTAYYARMVRMTKISRILMVRLL